MEFWVSTEDEIYAKEYELYSFNSCVLFGRREAGQLISVGFRFVKQWTSREKHVNAIYQVALAAGWHINKQILCNRCYRKRKERMERRVK